MTRRLKGIEDVGALNFVDNDDRKAFLMAMSSISVDAIKPPIAKIYETKRIKEVRLYVYDTSNWKYSLFLSCDLVK